MTAPSARGAMTGTLCPWCHDSLFALAQVDDATRTHIMDVHLTRLCQARHCIKRSRGVQLSQQACKLKR